MQNLFSFLFALFIALPSSASIDTEFEALKNSAINFEVTGTICEEVARLQFARKFQEPDFKVVTGIAYEDEQRTLGELDVIVFDNKTQTVTQVAEVKCWKNLKNGLDKAMDQRARFLKAIRSPAALHFRSTHTDEEYKKTQFKHLTSFTSIAQKGATSAGFDSELEYSLGELMGLREKLLACQSSGACPSPERNDNW